MAGLFFRSFNPLNTKLNPICHLLTLLRAHHILHVSRIRVNDNTSTAISIYLTMMIVTQI